MDKKQKPGQVWGVEILRRTYWSKATIKLHREYWDTPGDESAGWLYSLRADGGEESRPHSQIRFLELLDDHYSTKERLETLVGEYVRVTKGSAVPSMFIVGPLHLEGHNTYVVHIEDHAPTVAEAAFCLEDVKSLTYVQGDYVYTIQLK